MTGLAAPLDRLPDPLPVEPLKRPFDVSITPPGSKSLTCRAYVLSALADGESTITRPLRSDDTDRLLDALCALGAEARRDGEDVTIRGVAGRFPRGGEVNLGDGGAPTRFMIAAATLAAEPVIVDGSTRMRQRPVAEGVELLRAIGARIDYVEQDGHLPVRVTPTRPTGGHLDIGATASSQFVSAILLIAPWVARGVSIRPVEEVTSAAYVELTMGTLRAWGVETDDPPGILVRAAPVKARSYEVEPDASSAVYWMVAAGISPRSVVHIRRLESSSPQPDIAALEPLRQLGADIDTQAGGIRVTGPTGGLRPIDVEAACMPDASLALAAAASLAAGPSRLTGLKTLRVKESDRIAALAAELTRIGCSVATTGDSITIDPSGRHDRPARIETYRDHRMAMAFGVLGLARPGLSIADPACVAKSYPSFWSDLARLYDSPEG